MAINRNFVAENGHMAVRKTVQIDVAEMRLMWSITAARHTLTPTAQGWFGAPSQGWQLLSYPLAARGAISACVSSAPNSTTTDAQVRPSNSTISAPTAPYASPTSPGNVQAAPRVPAGNKTAMTVPPVSASYR